MENSAKCTNCLSKGLFPVSVTNLEQDVEKNLKGEARKCSRGGGGVETQGKWPSKWGRGPGTGQEVRRMKNPDGIFMNFES